VIGTVTLCRAGDRDRSRLTMPPRRHAHDALGRIERRLDQQLGGVAGLVLLLVGDELDCSCSTSRDFGGVLPPDTQNVSSVEFGRP
jgi:hypothetical protein